LIERIIKDENFKDLESLSLNLLDKLLEFLKKTTIKFGGV